MKSITAVLAAVAVVLGAGAGAARAQDFPSKPIQVVVPAGPGSATDTVVRLILNKIDAQKTLGRPFVVVNVNGGPIAATRVKDATPDGHELLVYHAGMLGLKAVGKLPFGAEAFETLAQTGATRFLVLTAAQGPYKDLRTLVDAAKARPNQIQEANSIGGAVHIATMLLAKDAGYQARIVNVGDGPKRLASVLGGHTAYTVASPAEYLGFQGAGIQAVAIVGPERNPLWPNVPSTRELGFQVDFSVDTWWFAPKATPAATTRRLTAALAQAMGDAGLREALAKQGVDPVFLDAAAAKARVEAVDAAVQPLGPALGG